jgi:hypothetical protein
VQFDLLEGERITGINCTLNPDNSLFCGLLCLDRFAKSPVIIDVGGRSISYDLPPHLAIQPSTNFVADLKLYERIPPS